MGKGKSRKQSKYAEKMTNKVNALGKELFFSLVNQQTISSASSIETSLPNLPVTNNTTIPKKIEEMNVAFIACGGIIIIDDKQCIEIIDDNNEVIKFTILGFKLSDHLQILIVENLSSILMHYKTPVSKTNYIQQYYKEKINSLHKIFLSDAMQFSNIIEKRLLDQKDKVNELLKNPLVSMDAIYSLIRKDVRVNALVKDTKNREHLPTLIIKNNIVEYKKGIDLVEYEESKPKKRSNKKIVEEPKFNDMGKNISDSIFTKLNNLNKNSSLPEQPFEPDEYIEDFFNKQTSFDQFATQSSSSSGLNMNSMQNFTIEQLNQRFNNSDNQQHLNEMQFSDDISLNGPGILYASSSNNHSYNIVTSSGSNIAIGSSSLNYIQSEVFTRSDELSNKENYMEFSIGTELKNSIKDATLPLLCFDELSDNSGRAKSYRSQVLHNVEIVEVSSINMLLGNDLSFKVYALLNTKALYTKENIILPYFEYKEIIEDVTKLKNLLLSRAINIRKNVNNYDELVLLPNIYLLNGKKEACVLFAKMSIQIKNELMSLLSSGEVKFKLHKAQEHSQNIINSAGYNDNINEVLTLGGKNNVIYSANADLANIDKSFFRGLNDFEAEDSHNDIDGNKQQSKRMKILNDF